jgi:hypothetical protein
MDSWRERRMMMTSLPVTGLLSGSIFTREVRFAYHISAFRLAKIYVPFVDVTEARSAPLILQVVAAA